jgi:cytidyltransferase-like protein
MRLAVAPKDAAAASQVTDALVADALQALTPASSGVKISNLADAKGATIPRVESLKSLVPAGTTAQATLFRKPMFAGGAGPPVRVYIDGCFDIMHSGHYNAIRQAKQFADVLVVGVHSNREIAHHKGPPVMTDDERMATVEACKWVDEIVFDTPYNPSLELLDKLNCDFCVHGDDTSTTANGEDAYAEMKKAVRSALNTRAHLNTQDSRVFYFACYCLSLLFCLCLCLLYLCLSLFLFVRLCQMVK